jgi:hypothetical protein
MAIHYQCPVCHYTLMQADYSTGIARCPTCRHPISVSDPEPSPIASSRPRSKPDKGNYKILVPIGYVAFVLLPIVAVLYFLISYANRPAQVQAEKSTQPADHPPAPIQKSHIVPEKKKTVPPPDKSHKDSVSSIASTPDLQGSKQDTPSLKTEVSKIEATPPPSDNLAPPPRMIETKEYGTLRLTTMFAVKSSVEAWVYIDGVRKTEWKFGKTEVEMKLVAGQYAVKVVSTHQGVRRVVYEGDIEISANKAKEVSVDQKPVDPKK